MIFTRTAALIGCALSLSVTAAFAQATVTPTPVSDPALKAYMKSTVDPAANAVFAGGNDAPAGETPAQAAARYKAAEEGARALQAAAIRLAQPDWNHPGDWTKFNMAMASAAKAGEAAAKAKNAEAAFAAGGDLYESCNGCHHQYQAGH